MPSEKIKQKALETLDNMLVVVKAEKMKHGEYISADVTDPSRAGAICQGRDFCLLGTAWISYGIPVKQKPLAFGGSYPFLEGVAEGSRRDEFLRHRPALKLVYDALNEAAQKRLDRLTIRQREAIKEAAPVSQSTAEVLFEGGSEIQLWHGTSYELKGFTEKDFEAVRMDRNKQASLIRSARKIVEA